MLCRLLGGFVKLKPFGKPLRLRESVVPRLMDIFMNYVHIRLLATTEYWYFHFHRELCCITVGTDQK